MSEFVFETSHQIFFSTDQAVPISDLVKSLLALEKIILSSKQAFEGVTAVEIDKIEVLISKIESGSLTEDIFVKFFFKDQAGLDAFIEKARTCMLSNKAVVISSVIVAAIGLGALYAAMQSKSGEQPQTTINENNIVIFNIGAGEVSMTPESFQAVVETAIKDKKALAENTVNFFKPARGDKGASIIFDESETIRFTPEVIAATPFTVKTEKSDHSKDYSDVDLQIRATDLDNFKRGWAGLVPELFDRRIPLKLSESVNPHDLNHFQVRADITIFYKKQKRGSGSELVPDYILVRNVIK